MLALTDNDVAVILNIPKITMSDMKLAQAMNGPVPMRPYTKAFPAIPASFIKSRTITRGHITAGTITAGQIAAGKFDLNSLTGIIRGKPWTMSATVDGDMLQKEKRGEYLTYGDIPSYWRQALNLVQEYDPDACISGGAMRDLDLHRDVKDLDIFVTAGTQLQAIKDCFAFNGEYDNWLSAPEYVAGNHGTWDDNGKAKKLSRKRRILTSITAEPASTNKDPNAVPINVIMLAEGQDPREDWREFDFGICQISFDGNRIICSPEYLEDKEAMELRLVNCPDQFGFGKSMIRAARLLPKMGAHWQLSLPEKYLEYWMMHVPQE